MRHLGLALALGLSASTLACGGAPHDSPDSIVFGAPVILSCPSSAASGGQVGHFTASGASDLAACNTRSTISTFVNDGTGDFRTGTVANVDNAGDFQVLDVDGDGRSDIVFIQSNASDGPYIAFARKDGTFAPPVEQPAFPYYDSETRFSIDGSRDAFVYDSSTKTEYFYDLVSDGSTVLIKSVSVPSRPYFADLDGDGNVDMAFAIGSTVAVQLGYGGGAFGAAQVVLVADNSVFNVMFGDLDGDGSTDIIAETNTATKHGYMYAFATNKGGTFQVVNAFDSVDGVRYDFQDATGDGIVDVVLSQDAQIIVMVGKGDGTFSDKALLLTGPWTTASYVFSDLNGDGKPDLVVADSSNVSVLLRQ